MVNVTWEDAQAYAQWLSQVTGKTYRLPIEAEWEDAARGGQDSIYWWGYQVGEGNAICFNCGTEWDRQKTAPVGSLKPNQYGLYDSAGNAMEWTADCYNASNGRLRPARQVRCYQKFVESCLIAA